MKIYSDNAITKNEVNDLKDEIADDHKRLDAKIQILQIALAASYALHFVTILLKYM